MGTNFNCISPFGWANKGEKELLCPFLLSVGVMARSLDYDDAIAGAVDVKAILAKPGLAEAEVAFVEMVDKCLGHLGGGPRLLLLDPIADSVPGYRSPSALRSVSPSRRWACPTTMARARYTSASAATPRTSPC